MMKNDETWFILLLKEYAETFKTYDGRLERIFAIIFNRKFEEFKKEYTYCDNIATMEFKSKEDLRKVGNYLIDNLEYVKKDFKILNDVTFKFPLFNFSPALKEYFKEEKLEENNSELPRYITPDPKENNLINTDSNYEEEDNIINTNSKDDEQRNIINEPKTNKNDDESDDIINMNNFDDD